MGLYYDGVRQAMLDFTKEVLDGYEVDGIEYELHAHVLMFKVGEGKKTCAPSERLHAEDAKSIDTSRRRRGCRQLLLACVSPRPSKNAITWASIWPRGSKRAWSTTSSRPTSCTPIPT